MKHFSTLEINAVKIEINLKFIYKRRQHLKKKVWLNINI